MNEILLEVKHVSKRFGQTQALKDVSLTIRAGTIHSLLGRNGAGKSTVVNIIAGIHQQNEGEVLMDGQDITPYSVYERQKLGIRIVPQHASVIPDVTVAENVFMGIWPQKKNGLVDWKRLRREAEAELKKYGLYVDPDAKVRTLNGVDMRKVNIVRAMHGGAKLIILDEPTTALSTVERQELFSFVNNLKTQGTAFIFISHYLQEVVELSDEVTVIRDGYAFSGTEGGGFWEEHLARLVAGETVELVTRTKPIGSAPKKLLKCEHLTGAILQNVSLELYEKEIVGLVGFPGSGARELCRSLFGLEKLHSGNVYLSGKRIRTSTPSIAMRQGINYLSFDRHKEGIIQQLSINENINLPLYSTTPKKNSGLINWRAAAENAKYYFDILKMKANSINDTLSSLSGGNQQKVVVAKALGTRPRVIILDEPTIGIDIKSREEIIANINQLTQEEDVSVLYLANDFDELLRITDRIIFFADGKLTANVVNDGLTHEDVIQIRDSAKWSSHPELDFGGRTR